MVLKRYLRFLPVMGIVAVTSVVVSAVLFVVNLMNDAPAPRVRVQQISLLPPPPPPQIEKPPEVMKETPPMDAPKDAPPLDNPNATENTSGDGPVIAFGKPGSGIGEPFGNYSADLKADIHNWFSQDKKLRRQNYAVVLKVWIANSGRIARVELANSTGNGELDQRLRLMVAGLVGKVREPPPQEMPQPVRLGVRSQL